MDNFSKCVDQYSEKDKGSELSFLLTVLFFILVSALIVTVNTWYIKVVVDGSSMYPTLQNEQVVTVSTVDDYDYGSIIVIKDELKNDWIVKRVIAKGGDTVKIENGKVYLRKQGTNSFIELQEDYLADSVKTYPANNKESEIYHVLEDEIFYLGDNRRVSEDSRGEFGTCEESQVVGVVKESLLWLRPVDHFIFKLFGKI